MHRLTRYIYIYLTRCTDCLGDNLGAGYLAAVEAQGEAPWMCPYCDAALCARAQARRGVARTPCLQPARLLPGDETPLPVGTRVEANWEGLGLGLA